MTARGHAKILDFGLAKLSADGRPLSEASPEEPTLLTAGSADPRLTSPGSAVGTLAYMSPEQATGEELDARTDLFSFGAVLYEMVTAKAAFNGNTSALIFDAMLHKPPVAPVRLNPELPQELERIVSKALEKDRRLRYQTAAELAVDLRRLKREIDSGRSNSVSYSSITVSPATSSAGRARGKIALMAAVALIVVLGLAYLLRPTLPPPRITGSTQITNDGQQKMFVGQTGVTLLTDGPRVFIQEKVDGRFVVAQASSGGGDTVCFTGTEEEQVLWGLPVLGGTPRRLSDIPGVDGTWMPDGDLLVSHQNGLWVVPKQGGTGRKFVDSGSFSWRFRWSPDGRALRYTRNNVATPGNELLEISADGTNSHQVLPGWHDGGEKLMGSWTADGKYFVFILGNTDHDDIWAVREKGDWFHKVDRQPIRLTSGPLAFDAPQPSADGKRIFAVGAQLRAELSCYDPKSGGFLPYLGGISAGGVSFSPDKQWVAYSTSPEGLLWRSRVDGSEKLQLASSQAFFESTRWSPDGRQIAYVSRSLGQPDRLLLVGKDGGSPRVLYQSPSVKHPSWRSDGSALVFAEARDVIEKSEIKTVDLKSGQVNTLAGSTGLARPVVSPDGRFVASGTADGKKLKLYDFSTQAWQEFEPAPGVGGTEWSADSRYLYFDNGLSTDPAVYRLRIADHKVEHVVSLKNLRRALWGNLPWFGLTPNGDPLICAMWVRRRSTLWTLKNRNKDRRQNVNSVEVPKVSARFARSPVL